MSVEHSITDKLADLHSKLKLNYGNFSEEYPEQEMAAMYIKPDDINTNIEWYNIVLDYIDKLVESNPTIQTQKELTNYFMKIIGYSDIIIEQDQTIIDVKTSSYEYPKLEYLLQIIIYGLLNESPINRYQIYNPIYGIIYEWSFKGDKKNKLIDYISSILNDINKKRTYCNS